MKKGILFLFAVAITIPLLWSSCSSGEKQTTVDTLMNSSTDSTRHRWVSIQHDTDVNAILHLKILNHGGGYSDLSKVEVGVTCSVLEVYVGHEINVGDTVLFWQTEYNDDTIHKASNAERIKNGREYIVTLRPRKKDEIIYADSSFVHYNGIYHVQKIKGETFIDEENEEYVLVRMVTLQEFKSFPSWARSKK